jgi:hypothetical protein
MNMSMMNRYLTGLALLVVLSAMVPAQGEPASIPAFPGAEGAGALTVGGRGGRVIEVTNLNDGGPGSLREAVSAAEPRIVVFRVAGLIALERPIVVQSPYLTLAGQSAPGDGVCLRDYAFVVATHDVVIRYLRSRCGDLGGRQEDCIDLAHGARNVVLDHCSGSWSIDEVLSLAGNVSDVTVQWCLIAESLDDSKHPKGPHGCGSLVRANGKVTLHHNLWAHNRTRNVRLGDNYGRPPYPAFDFRNNVIYDYGQTCTGITQGRFTINYVANYLRPGPSSRASHLISVNSPSDMRFYIRNNVFDGNKALTEDNTRFFSAVEIDGHRQVEIVSEPFEMPPVQTRSAEDAYEAVLASVGASLPVRDAVDARIVADVRNRTGSVIDSQAQVGGWPEYRSGPPVPDSDHDGMPDEWEQQHAFDPQNAADGSSDKDGDGYTNVEEFLNNTNPGQRPQ